MFIVLYL